MLKINFKIFSSIVLMISSVSQAAPYLCSSNGATYSIQAMCDNVCEHSCEEMDPSPNNAGTCDTVSYEGFISDGTTTYAISKSTNFWESFTDLAIPNTSNENDLIQGIVNYYNSNAWIGIYDPLKTPSYNNINTSRFKNKNGIAISYYNWEPGQPDNKNNNNDIGSVPINGEHWAYISTNGRWRDDGYHASYGGDYKAKYKAIGEWNGKLDCVSGVSKPSDINITGYWCEDGDGNIAQCNIKIEAPICQIGSFNLDTGRCENGLACEKGIYNSVTKRCDNVPDGKRYILVDWDFENNGFGADGVFPVTVNNSGDYITVFSGTNLSVPPNCVVVGGHYYKTNFNIGYCLNSDINVAGATYGQKFTINASDLSETGQSASTVYRASDSLGFRPVIISARTFKGSVYASGIETETITPINNYQSRWLDITTIATIDTSYKTLTTTLAKPPYSVTFTWRPARSIADSITTILAPSSTLYTKTSKIVITYKTCTDGGVLLKGSEYCGKEEELLNEIGNNCGSLTPDDDGVCGIEPTCDENLSYSTELKQCVNQSSCPLGNYQCTDVSNSVEDTDSVEGEQDKQNNGKLDSNGNCLGTMYIFNGADKRCRTVGIQTGFADCCKKGTTWFGLGQCGAAEKTLGKLRQYGELDGNCHYVGKYCALKWPIGGCAQSKKTYCCFSSPLARIIHEGGRPQLGIEWGSPKAPQCRGFTPDEFQKIDFSKVDFSEWIQYDVVPNVQNNAVGNIQNVINNIDTNLAP